MITPISPQTDSPEADTPLLELLDADSITMLRRLSRGHSYAPGAAIVRQGEPAVGAYLLESGHAEVSVALPGGGEVALGKLGPGSVMGEMALLDHGICSATVMARTSVNMMMIEREAFRALVARRDTAVLKIQQAVTWVLCRKLRAVNAKVMRCEAPEDVVVRDPGEPSRDHLSSEGIDFNWRAFLPVLPVFQDFSVDNINEVVSCAVPLRARRGQRIFVAGDEVDASYIVVRGAVEVSGQYASERGTRKRRLAVLGPGEWLGAMSLLDSVRHGTGAVAREDTVLLRVSRAAFETLYYAETGTAMKVQQAIQRTLLHSMRHTNNSLARLIGLARIRERRESVASGARELESALYSQFCLLRQ